MSLKNSTKDANESLKAIYNLLTSKQAHMESQDTRDKLLQQTMDEKHDTLNASIEALISQVSTISTSTIALPSSSYISCPPLDPHS